MIPVGQLERSRHRMALVHAMQDCPDQLAASAVQLNIPTLRTSTLPLGPAGSSSAGAAKRTPLVLRERSGGPAAASWLLVSEAPPAVAAAPAVAPGAALGGWGTWRLDRERDSEGLRR